MDELPIGRRVAYWRTRRKMSQQVFADRLGKSKSWVDKVERGVRRLGKFSVVAATPLLVIARSTAQTSSTGSPSAWAGSPYALAVGGRRRRLTDDVCDCVSMSEWSG